MQKFTVTAPAGVPFEVIRAALVALDAGIDVKPSVKRARMTTSASDSTPEYVGQSDMEYRRYCPKDTEGAEYCPQSERWYMPEVMDGVSVQKAINKIMAEVRKGQSSDGRGKRAYPEFGTSRTETDVGYIHQFCDALHHVPAKYTNGVTA
jgi:hypothetical protein